VTKASLHVARNRINTVIAASWRDFQWPGTLVFNLIVTRKETAPFCALSLYSDICRHVADRVYTINKRSVVNFRQLSSHYMSVQIPILWEVTQRSLVVSHRRSGTTYQFHNQGPSSSRTIWPSKKIPIGFPETSVSKYLWKMRDITEKWKISSTPRRNP